MSIVRLPPKGGIFNFSGSGKVAAQTDFASIPREIRAMADATPLYDTYSRAPLRFERGEGVWLIAEDGSRYLDFAAGVAVNSLGHAHPHLVESL